MQVEIEKLPGIKVMYLSSNRGPQDAPKLFFKLERLIGLKEGKLYGAFWVETGEYWACVAIKDTEVRGVLGLKKAILPSGLYARSILKGRYRDIVRQIPSVFKEMAISFTPDPKRPSIEHYFRFTEFFLYLPIKTSDNNQ